MGFKDMKNAWPVLNETTEHCLSLLENNVWQHVPEAVTMRNNLVHGSRVYKLSHCRDKAIRVKKAIEVLRDTAMRDLGCDPWRQLPRKKKTCLVWLGLQQSEVSSK